MRSIVIAAFVVIAAPAFAEDPVGTTTTPAQSGTTDSVPAQTPDDPTSKPDESDDGSGPATVDNAQPATPQAPNDPTSAPDESDPNHRADAPAYPGPATTDPAVKPDAPAPEIPNPAEDIRTYAGVGSDVAYADLGVGEFGGSASLSLANDLFQVSADPTLGYFAWDNIELSALLGIKHTTLSGQASNQFSVLAEPSVHLPINDGLFVVGGVGAGVAVLDTSTSDLDAGFALAPRAGVQVLLGRSGLFNVGARYSAVFSNVATNLTPEGGETYLAFQNTLDLQAGYTVMF